MQTWKTPSLHAMRGGFPDSIPNVDVYEMRGRIVCVCVALGR